MCPASRHATSTACRGVAGALGERRRITAVVPEVVIAEDAVWLTMPADLEYPL